MNPVLIIVAMRFEASKIENRLIDLTQTTGTGFPYAEGKLNNIPVAICVGGVGKINAAAATAAMIERLKPQLVINTGCAGAYFGSGLHIGDLAIAKEEILGDEGATTSSGWLDLKEMNLPYLTSKGQSYYNILPLSNQVTTDAIRFAHDKHIKITTGRFITLSTCSGSLDSGHALTSRFNGIAENMEGAAVALTCLRYGVDCLELRGISNMVEERDLDKWNIRLAVDNAQDFVLKYIGEIASRAD